jgi:DNA polymerase (family 10)
MRRASKPKQKRDEKEEARRRLARIPGLGAHRAAGLVARGIRTKAQLRAIAGELPAEARASLRHHVSRQTPLAEARGLGAELRRRLVFETPSTGRRRKYPVRVVGSVRRGAPRAKDLDLLVIVPEGTPTAGLLATASLAAPGGGAAAAAAAAAFGETYASGPRRRSLIVRRRAPGGGGERRYAVDLFLATEKEKPYALFHYTGGREYNIRVRAHAKRQGYTLNQYGLYRARAGEKGRGGAARGRARRRARGTKGIRTERDLMRFLGVTYRPPTGRGTA